jgi:hypothetical protein
MDYQIFMENYSFFAISIRFLDKLKQSRHPFYKLIGQIGIWKARQIFLKMLFIDRTLCLQVI